MIYHPPRDFTLTSPGLQFSATGAYLAINVHFTEQDWDRTESDWMAWWAGELDRPLVIIEGREQSTNIIPSEVRDFASNFPLDMSANDVIDYYQAQLEAKRFYGDAWPKWWPNFGPGIGAAFLGARLESRLDTVWFEPAVQKPIEALSLNYSDANMWWQRVQELTRTAVDRWGDQVAVGHTDIGGNLDILASLHTTQQLLFELHDAPDDVARLVGEITPLWLRYYDELLDITKLAGRGTTTWAPIWSPDRCYMLQSDFSYMISPEMFERFVMPDLAACCENLDHAFYHLDGVGQIRHVNMLLSLERLRGIQWIPGAGQPPPEAWLPLLSRIRAGGKLCQLYVTPEGARTIMQALGGRGFAFYIDQAMSRDEADDFLGILAAANTST
jgi:5-methyltetrahydrofolate--homocysteine methyltransferase